MVHSGIPLPAVAPAHVSSRDAGTRASDLGTDPRSVWLALIPEMSPRSVVCVSRDRGRSYPRSCDVELASPAEVPCAPAAMYVYGQDGTGRLLILDFDTHDRHSPDHARADAEACVAILRRTGARSIMDTSPSGGLHVYVPFSTPLPYAELRRLAEAVAVRLHTPAHHGTLDVRPMQNPSRGLIRPPGSPHRSGGHQTLITPLAEAVDIARRGNGHRVWNRLLDEFEAELSAVDPRPYHLAGHSVLFAEAQAARAGTPPLSPSMEAIALRAAYDRDRYPSPSEARQAVLVYCAARGCSLAAVAARLRDGSWPGLARIYARKHRSRAARVRALRRDWNSAQRFLARRLPAGSPGRGGDIGRSSPQGQKHVTPRSEPAGPAHYRRLREWLGAVHILDRVRYRARPTVRLLLRGLAAMAAFRGRGELRVGVRALSLACCLDRTTVSRDLASLFEEEDSPVVLLERGDGRRADRLALRVPEQVAQQARWRRWRAGFIAPVHPVFLALGIPAALAFDALSLCPSTTRELAGRCGVPDRTLRRALTDLGACGLARREGSGWARVPDADLARAAGETGGADAFARRVERYRRERGRWRGVVGGEQDEACATGHGAGDSAVPATPEPDPRDVGAPCDAPMPTPPEPEWLRQARPAWLCCPPSASGPVHIDPPEPPDVSDPCEARWPEQAVIYRLARAAADAGPLYAAPGPGARLVTRSGRLLRPRVLEWREAADRLGLPEDLAQALRPSGRRWNSEQIDLLLADPPAWLRGGLAAVRAEARRRRDRAERRRRRAAERRRSWAEALGMALWRVPASGLKAATESNIEAFYADPPPWATGRRNAHVRPG